MLIETDELFEILNDKFPDEVPHQVDNMRDLGIKVGEQKVIKYIAHVLEQKEHEIKHKSKKATK